MEKELEQTIVEDLSKHRGLSVDTIMKISSKIDDINKFKILAGIIKNKFEGINGEYKKSLEAPLIPQSERLNKRRKEQRFTEFKKNNYQKNIEEYRIRQQKNFQNRQNSLASSLPIRKGQKSFNKTSKKDQNRRKNTPPPKRQRQIPLF